MPKINKAETLLAVYLKEVGFEFREQVRLDPRRRFRWDFVAGPLAIEVQGGVHQGGHHTRGQGYEDDCEKMRLAILHGYVPVYFTSADVLKGRALEWLHEFKNQQHLPNCAAHHPGWSCDKQCRARMLKEK